jgi:hypothetical protein
VTAIFHAVFRIAGLHHVRARPPVRRVGLHFGQEMAMMEF